MPSKQRAESLDKLIRVTEWNGFKKGDDVVALDPNGDPLRGTWTFQSHVTDPDTGKTYVEVIGGKKGHMMSRALREERIERV